MSITTYAELKTAMGSWLDRTDLSSQLADFIALFEARVNRRLAVRPQITTSSITLTSGSGTLPTDYLLWKKATWAGSENVVLTYVSSEYLDARYPTAAAGTPRHFTIEGSTLKVRPVDDSAAVTFLYAQKVPALSDSATTNWLLTSHPDAYLFGALTMSATFTEDATQGPVWNDLTQQALGELWNNEWRQFGPLVQQASGATP